MAGFSKALVFVLSGLSKIVGLPQMKLGWITVSGPDILKSQAVERLELIADNYLSVSTPVMNALPGLSETIAPFQENLIKRLKRNYDYVQKIFLNSPFRVLTCEGGWTVVLEVPKIMSEEEWAYQLLQEENALAYPGYFFDFEKEAFLVLSLIVEEAVFDEGLTRIIHLFNKHSSALI